MDKVKLAAILVDKWGIDVYMAWAIVKNGEPYVDEHGEIRLRTGIMGSAVEARSRYENR